MRTILVTALVSGLIVLGLTAILIRHERSEALNRVRDLEIEKTKYRVELETLEDSFHELSAQLQLAELKAEEEVQILHQENETRESRITSLDRQREDLLDELELLRSALREIPPTPESVVIEHCPELPLLKRENVVLENMVSLCESIVVEQREVIHNKDEEIRIERALREAEKEKGFVQTAIIENLKSTVNVQEEQIRILTTPKRFSWLPSPSVGVAFTCDTTGRCVAGPSVGLMWKF